MRSQEKEVVWLAALLHDLGKFRQRAAQGPRWSHEEHGRRFVEEDFRGYFMACGDDLAHAIANHHRPHVTRPIEKLVVLADRLSAREREREDREREEPFQAALLAVLTRPPIAPDGHERGYPLGVLALGRDPEAERSIFPAEAHRVRPADYAALWQSFQNEFTAWVGHRGYQSADFETLVALLRKYTSRMPSATPWEGEAPRTTPDISLYDHLKTTAALAACLERQLLPDDLDSLLKRQPEAETQPLCALIKGDISGTQDFLHLLTASGAARGLRGRSFYLQLLTETVARWLLRQLELPVTNLLFAGGGHFYLLAPYRDAGRLENLACEVAQRLWRAHRGDLFLILDYVPVTARNFAGGDHSFATRWADVSRQLQHRKQRKGSELGAGLVRLFQPQEQGGTDEICRVCHAEGDILPDRDEPDNPDRRKCQRCRAFERLGAELRGPTHLALFQLAEHVPPRGDFHDTLADFGVEMYLCQRGQLPEAPPGATSVTLFALDTTDFLLPSSALEQWNGLACSHDFRLLADATPRIRNSKGDVVIADFHDLAEASTGVPWFGVLRMDVDDLGSLFRSRLGRQATIARVSAVSEALRLFFESWVPQRCCQRNDFDPTNGTGQDRLYLIYAGGDDLFVVGAWSELPDLAQAIRKDFERFVGGDHLKLSAGIAIEHAKFPLYQLADSARHWLDVAKAHVRLKDGKQVSKDAVCFLQRPLGWEQFEQVQAWKQRLLGMLQPADGSPGVARGILTRLGEVFTLYQQNAARQRRRLRTREITDAQIRELIAYDRWQWQLVYHLGRFAERSRAFRDEVRALQQAIVNEQLIEVLGPLARWTELLTREDRA